MKSGILGALAAILSFTSIQAKEVETIYLGQETLSLPSPQDLQCVDLPQPMSDELALTITSSGNSLLALYGRTPITVGDKPIFHAQAPLGTEDVIFSTQQFEEVASSLATLFGDTSNASETTLPNGEAQYLGIYDQGDHHLNFATLSRLAGQTPSDEGLLTYVAASMNNVNGKIISLYCVTAAEPESNRALAREQLATWQQAVLASNPAAQSETMSPMRRGAMIGGVAGLLGALIGLLVLKRKKA